MPGEGKYVLNKLLLERNPAGKKFKRQKTEDRS